MNNKNAIAALSIVLASVVAIGGWALASRLMSLESDRLLAEITYIQVETPAVEINRQHNQPLQLNEVRIVINDEILEQLGIVQDGMLMIPAHAIAEVLGELPPGVPEFAQVRDIMEHFPADVNWDFDTQTIYIYSTTQPNP